MTEMLQTLNPPTIDLGAVGGVPPLDLLVMWTGVAVLIAALLGLARSVAIDEHHGGYKRRSTLARSIAER